MGGLADRVAGGGHLDGALDDADSGAGRDAFLAGAGGLGGEAVPDAICAKLTLTHSTFDVNCRWIGYFNETKE